MCENICHSSVVYCFNYCKDRNYFQLSFVTLTYEEESTYSNLMDLAGDIRAIKYEGPIIISNEIINAPIFISII